MRVGFASDDLADISADILVIPFVEGTKLDGASAALDKKVLGLISDWIRIEEFKGKDTEILEIQTHGRIPARKIFVTGLGKRKDLSPETVRRQIAEAIKRCRGAKLVAAPLFPGQPLLSAEAMTFGAIMGDYHFGKYFKEDEKKHVEEFMMVGAKAAAKSADKGITRGRAIADAVTAARHFVNEPSSDMTPTRFASELAKFFKGTKVELKVYKKAELKKMGMNAFLGVAKGSHEPPVMVHLTYKPTKKAKKRIALVGKGITFDTGGVSLKPADYMETMKMDMAGAAAVCSTMLALAELSSPYEVHAIAALTENMPGGGAYKPDDILVAKNGKSIEIANTDAEGRVTMADTLSYASDLEPDEIIDLATLTGAAVVALGNQVAAVMGRGDVKKKIMAAAKTAGEEMWELPLFDPYRDLNKAQWADVRNTGKGREAGTITAGLFLSEFVDQQIPWVHLDIAGPAWSFDDRHYLRKEGTGFGVRTLVEYLSK